MYSILEKALFMFLILHSNWIVEIEFYIYLAFIVISENM